MSIIGIPTFDFGIPNPGSFPPPGIPGSVPGGQTTLPFNPTAAGKEACKLLPAKLRALCEAGISIFPGGGPTTPTVPSDPTPGTLTPGEVSTGAIGIQLPQAVARQVFVCPRYADGKTGILWFSAMTNQVVCLPRGVSGKPFGLIRKNPKRKKAYISAAQIKQLRSVDSTKKKAKEFAKLAGLHTHAAHRRGR